MGRGHPEGVAHTALAVQLLIFALGALLVAKGADWFTEAAVSLARSAGLSRVLVGATIVSFATTLPEFAVSSYSAYTGRPDMAVGNAVGSVIANTCFILATALVVRPVRVERSALLPRAVFAAGAGAMVFFLFRDGDIGRPAGIALLSLLLLYTWHSWRSGRAAAGEAAATAAGVRWTRLAGGFLAGAALIILGSRFLVGSGVAIARAVGVPEVVIALTLVAVGTSLPELATSIASLLKGYQDLSLGNIMGANFLNLTLVLGGAALIHPLPAARQVLAVGLPVMLAAVLLATLFGLTRRSFGRREGLVLLGMYTLYLVLTFTGGS